MIQDIGPHVYKNEYKPQSPAKNSYVMYFEKGKLLAKFHGDLLEFPTFAEMEAGQPDIYEKATYLFAIDGVGFYLVDELQYEDGTFKPENEISRAEVMTVINKLLGRCPSAEYVKSLELNPFSDLNKNKWYYTDVIEATKTHNYYLDATEKLEIKWEDYK